MGQTLSCLRTRQAANDVPRRQVPRRTVSASELRRPATRRNAGVDQGDNGNDNPPVAHSEHKKPSSHSGSPRALSDTAVLANKTEDGQKSDEPARPKPGDDRSGRTTTARSESSRIGSELGGTTLAPPEPAWRAEVRRRTEAVKRASTPVRRASSSLDASMLQSGRPLSSPASRASSSGGGGSDGQLLRANKQGSVDKRTSGGGSSEVNGVRIRSGARKSAMRKDKPVTGLGPLNGRRRVRFDDVASRGISWRRGHEPKDSLDEIEGAEEGANSDLPDVEWADTGKSLVQLGIEKFDGDGKDGSPPTRTIVTRSPSRIDDGDNEGNAN